MSIFFLRVIFNQDVTAGDRHMWPNRVLCVGTVHCCAMSSQAVGQQSHGAWCIFRSTYISHQCIRRPKIALFWAILQMCKKILQDILIQRALSTATDYSLWTPFCAQLWPSTTLSLWWPFQPNISNIYSTVGRSIAAISDLRRHIYWGANHRGKYAAEVRYRGYRPTYRNIVQLVRNRRTFCLKALPKLMPFSLKVDMAYIRPLRNG